MRGERGEREGARVVALIARLEALADPGAVAAARDLVQAVLEMHGAGLRRFVEVVAAQGASGRAILESVACDRTVASLLLLHDLHPHDPPTRIDRAIADLRAELGGYAIAIELVDASPQCIRVRLSSQGARRRPASPELRERVESALFARAPDIEAVEIEGLPLPDVHELRFFPRPVAVDATPVVNPAGTSFANPVDTRHAT